jgi:3-hydroxyisobutyrate dehydrogenase-like beta-hydroxyacid dehydrogenase
MRQGVIRRVGVVGLGKMGRPMARHLRKAGFEVTGCDIDPSACGEAEKAGIAIADSPRALAQSSDFIIVVVGFDKEAETVILGSDGIAAGAAPGLLVGVASTVAPRTMERLAAGLAGTGVGLLNMPITRGEPAAEAGELLVWSAATSLPSMPASRRCTASPAAFSILAIWVPARSARW